MSINSEESDEKLVASKSDSFWDPGNYKRTVKRTEDGFRLCTDLMTLIQERAEIEKNYGKSLKTWSKKWSEIIEKGPEYGTMEAAWKAVLEEADRRCDMHTAIKDNLVDKVCNNIKQWQKDNYHKSMMTLKEKKEFEDSFKKAQKPWAKLLEKVTKAKMEYHTCCKNERSAINQERNATGDTSLSPDQVKKLQDRVIKCKEEVAKSREKYEVALREISDYNDKYSEEMKDVFEKCQDFEEKRLLFFKEVLYSIHSTLNISNDPKLPIIYEEYRHTIQNADASKDLKWWSNNHGSGMPTSWPIFEEYIEEFRDIIGKPSKMKPGLGNTIADTGITLVNQHKFDEELPEYTPQLHDVSKKEGGLGSKKSNPSTVNSSESGGCGNVTLTHVSNHHYQQQQQHSIKGGGFVQSDNLHIHPPPSHHSPSVHSNNVVNSVSTNGGSNKHHHPHPSSSMAPAHLHPSHRIVTASNNHHHNPHSARNSSSIHETSNNRGVNHQHHHSVAASSAHHNNHHLAHHNSSSVAVGGGRDAGAMNGGGGEECGPHAGHGSGSEEWDDYPSDALLDTGEPGIPVRALYDYEGAEADELSFKQGDIFEKLEDEDEQGWCKGRKDGRVGLYPANYVEPLPVVPSAK